MRIRSPLIATLCVAAIWVSATASASPGVAPATNSGLRLVKTIAAPGAVSARLVLDRGRGKWLYVSTAVSLIIYDVADPERPVEVGRLPVPTFQNEDIDGNDTLALLSQDGPVAAADSPAGGQLTIVSVRDKTQPRPIAVASLPDGAGHTATCLDDCRWVIASGGASLSAIDLAVPDKPVVTRVPAPVQSGMVHDAEQDADGVVWLSGFKGVTALAMRPISTLGSKVATLSASATPLRPVVLTSTGAPGSTPAIKAGLVHGSLRPRDIAYRAATGLRAGDVMFAAEEGTAADCRDGGRFHSFDARGVRTGAPLRLLDSVAPVEQKSTTAPGPGAGCSAHWFTTQGPLAAVAWFGAGLRLLDVSDPTRMRQVGRYVPTEPRTWSAYWIPGTRYIYALDLDRGIDVLQVTARAGGPEVGALDHGTRSVSVGDIAKKSLC